MFAIIGTVVNEEADLAQVILLLHCFNDVSLFRIRSISEFWAHSNLVSKSLGSILPLVSVSRLLADLTFLGVRS